MISATTWQHKEFVTEMVFKSNKRVVNAKQENSEKLGIMPNKSKRDR
jgi:hypothetical protein